MRFTPANLLNGVAFLGVGAIIVTTLAGEQSPGVDMMTTASITASASSALPNLQRANRFMVVDHQAGKTCIFALHRAEGYDVHRVEPAKNCKGVSQRLTDARAWQEMPNGAITITDRAGDAILKLGPADGFAYEVTEPSHLAMSLEAF
jgi:uncharacterized membrane protein